MAGRGQRFGSVTLKVERLRPDIEKAQHRPRLVHSEQLAREVDEPFCSSLGTSEMVEDDNRSIIT